MVTFALDADGDGTALTLTHDGWAQFPPADAPRLRLAHATGWSHHLDNLAAFLGAGR